MKRISFILALIAIIFAGNGNAASLHGSGSTLIPAITPTASTIVAKWTTVSAANSTMSCGLVPGVYTISAVVNGIETSVVNHFAAMAGLIPSTIYYCKIMSGSAFGLFTQATTALPSTTPLISATLSAPVQPVVNQINADFFSNCVSDDGITYLGSDDSHGWGNSATANMMVGKFPNYTVPLTGANVNLLSNFGIQGQTGSDSKTSKETSLYCDKGNIYILYSRIGQNGGFPAFTFGSILKSDNHGAHWSDGQAPNTYDPNGTFPPLTYTMFANSSIGASCNFLSYGPDDGTLGYPDNIDAYAYFICNDGIYDGIADHIYSLRIPRQSLPGLDATKIQYFVGGPTGNSIDGSLDGAWSTSTVGISILYSQTTPMSIPTLAWMATTGRYILMSDYDTVVNNPHQTTLNIFEMAHPWSIPTLIAGPINDTTKALYGYHPFQKTMGSATANGTPGTFFSSGDYTSPNYQFYTTDIVFNTH